MHNPDVEQAYDIFLELQNVLARAQEKGYPTDVYMSYLASYTAVMIGDLFTDIEDIEKAYDQMREKSREIFFNQ